MGSPLCLVANLFMVDFETSALSSSPDPAKIWPRFVDDTFIIHRAEHKQQFVTHLNSLDPNIQFTSEFPRPTGISSLLGDLKITRTKWDSYHHSLQKANTNTSIFALAQPPQHYKQIQYLQYSHTGPGMFAPTNSY